MNTMQRYPWVRLGDGFRSAGGWPANLCALLLVSLQVLVGCSPTPAPAPPAAPEKPRPAKVFSFQEYHRAAPGQPAQLKTHFQGADPKFNGGNILVKDLHLVSCDPSGRTNWVVDAADCLFDRNQKVALSSNTLSLRAREGALTIQGQGFYWRQSDDLLRISDETEASIRQGTNTIHVTSRGFEFDPTQRRVAFWKDVRTRDPEMEMDSEWLAIKLRESDAPDPPAPAEGGVESILAATNVVVRVPGQDTETRSQRALYTVADEREAIELTGDPTWRRGLRQGSGDRLYLDRRNRMFLAQGNTYAKLPSGEMLQPGDLFQSLSQNTNPPVAAKGTNEFVEIRADESRLWTNGAVFTGRVRANEVSANPEPVLLSCGILGVTNSTPKTAFDLIEMRDDVAIQQGATNIHAALMVYSKLTKVADFSGEAAWTTGPQSGGGDTIRLDLDRREMAARGRTTLLLPMDKATLPFVAELMPTNSMATNQPRFLRIRCAEYDLGSTQAWFRGQVLASQLEGERVTGTLACEMLIADLMQPGNRLGHLLAETNVVVEAPDANRTNTQRRLLCQRLVGEATKGAKDGLTRLTAEQDVVLQEEIRSEQGVEQRVARGKVLIYHLPEDEAELSGGTVLETPDSVMTSPTLRMNPKTGHVFAPGGWEVVHRPKRK